MINIIGTWSLVNFEIEGIKDSSFLYPYGNNPNGYLHYTDDGYMFGIITNQERSNFLSEDIKGGTTKEKEDAFSTCLSYCGRYEVQEKNAQIIHHIKASSFPNWTGRSVIRMFTIKANQLTLTTPTMQINAQNCVGVLTWIKV